MKSVSFGDLQDNKTERIPRHSPMIRHSPMNGRTSPPLMRFGSEVAAPLSFKLRSSNQSMGNIFYRNQNSLRDESEDEST